jgi:hypothetical protein
LGVGSEEVGDEVFGIDVKALVLTRGRRKDMVTKLV